MAPSSRKLSHIIAFLGSILFATRVAILRHNKVDGDVEQF